MGVIVVFVLLWGILKEYFSTVFCENDKTYNNICSNEHILTKRESEFVWPNEEIFDIVL